MLKFRVWDIKNKKYVENCAKSITNHGKLLIGKTYFYDTFTNTNPEDYVVEYCTGYKSVDGTDIYVNDYVEFKLGLKMVRARVVYDHFAFWVYEIRGGVMTFHKHDYKIIGNLNTNPVNDIEKVSNEA
jgi:hypothetical protein